MRKIILDLAVTLDGFIEGPKGEIDWITDDGSTDFADILTVILVDIDTVFYGRVSYEMWGNYVPGEKADANLKAAYDLLHSKKKVVFSKTIKNDGSNTVFIDSNIRGKVLQMLQQPGKNIWLYGGGKLITTFMNLGLIDMFRLAVYPVILGSGKPLFSEIQNRVGLKLMEVSSAGSGVVRMIYTSEKMNRSLELK